ncbi:MAG: MFS transporter [Bdellovibrionaceae bacterium]|nr:MFS transporter [Pseudobdellovibrionaceae bacterium]
MTKAGLVPVERSLKLSLADAFLYALMVGIGETYLPAFALSVGLGEVFAGILSSLPLVSGAVLQLFTPKGVERVGSHKAWVILSVTVQALAFLPLIYYSMGNTPHFWVLFLILSLYWGAGFSATPAWNYWIAHLVSDEISQKYFSQRAWVSQIGILLGLVIGGVALHNKVTIFSFSSVFAGLFFLAFLCRIGSSLFLSRKLFRPEWAVQKHEMKGLRASWRIFWASPVKRNFFLILFPYMGAVYLSAPFITPYLLAQLKLDYGAYMIAIAALMIGKMTALAFVSKAKTPKRGLHWLILGVATVSPLPALWAVSTNYAFILALQFVNGMTWAGIEVGLSLIFFKDLTPKEKVPILTIYNLLNAASIILGTLLGGFILELSGDITTGYLTLFILGAVSRVFFSRPLIWQARKWQETSGSAT